MSPSPTPNLPLYETDSDFAGQTPGESAVAETRSETARTLNTRPGFIEVPKNQDEEGDSSARKLRENEKVEEETFIANRFFLMESHLSPKGADYKIISEFPASV